MENHIFAFPVVIHLQLSISFFLNFVTKNLGQSWHIIIYIIINNMININSLLVDQSLSFVQLFATPWTAAYKAPLFSTIFQSLLKFMSLESVMLSNHLILCHPLLVLPSIFHSIFSSESPLHIRWPKYWSFSFSNSPSNEYSGLISFRTD